MSMPSLEVLTAHAPAGTSGRPVVFVHGICHGAWCWENYLPYFAAAGHDSHAVSLRGHAGSEGRERLPSFGLADYVDDVRSVVASLARKPILVGHSMGGAVVQQYLGGDAEALAGAVLFAPATAGGVTKGALLGTLFRNSPIGFAAAVRIAMGRRVSDRATAATPYFSNRLTPAQVAPHAARLQAESKRAFEDLGRPYSNDHRVGIPLLVIGSRADDLFPTSSLRRTAATYGVEPVILDELCHDMMLDPAWRVPADRVLEFIADLPQEG